MIFDWDLISQKYNDMCNHIDLKSILTHSIFYLYRHLKYILTFCNH